MCRVYYNKITNILFLLLLFLLFNKSFAEREAGLILSGLDTMQSGTSMDFVLARPCSTSGDNACNPHFSYGWHSDIVAYLAAVGSQGRMLDLGKTNLDSIKLAPPDSVMKDDLGLGQPYRFFRIALDSLSKCIGNVYLLKTGIDTRPGYGYQLYAKIKIINFIVVDSASHQIKMVFLWAYNDAGSYDLHTSGIDTFHLNGTIITSPRPNFASAHVFRSATGQYVFKVVGDRFVVPEELRDLPVEVVVYDLLGKKLRRIIVQNTRIIDLKGVKLNRGVVVVKVKR